MNQDDPMSASNGDQPPIDPELISAFYDGETTPEQRAAVEGSMEDAGRTLQRLDDYDQLSQSLKQLHRATRSPDLSASVLEQIRPSSTLPPAATSPQRRRLLQVVAGLTGLAAAVTLLLWPQPPARHERMVADSDTDYEFTAAQPAPALSAASPAAAPGAQPERTSPSAETARISAADVARMEADVSSSLAEIASQQPLPEVGEVVGYLDENADELTWVAVTVVDVQKAGDQVQLLLTRHGVPSPESVESVPESPPGPDTQVTFVVEADWDQLEAVIVDLTDSAFVNSLHVDAPEDEGVPRELQGYLVERGPRPAGDPPRVNLLARQLRQRVAGRQKQQAAGGASGKALRASADGPDAVQLQLLVPETDLQRLAARRGVDPAQSASEESGASAEEAPAPAPAGGMDRVLARPSAKAVIVIQAQNR